MENNFGPTETELQIKKLATSVATPAVRSSEQFMSDIKKTLASGTYDTQDEAIKGVLDYASSKGVTYKGIDSTSILAQLSEKTVKDEGNTGFTAETTEALGERGKNISDINTKFLEKTKKGAEDIKATFENEGAGAAFITTMKSELNKLGSVWQFVGQGAGAVSDVMWETLENTTQKVLPEEAEQAIQDVVSGIADTDTVQALGESYAGFRERNPETARNLEATFNIGGLLLDSAGIKLGAGEVVNLAGKSKTIAKDVLETGIEKTKKGVDTLTSTFKKEVDELPIEMRTVKGKIGDLEVEVPLVNRTITEKAVSPFTKDVTNKTLAGKAVSPRTVGKNRKMKLSSIADVEKRTQNFYNNIRTGKLEGDISTLENAAQSMVSNLDTVGERIGNAVKKVDGYIDFDNNLTDDIINALYTKGAEVSPATPILDKFFKALGNGKLTIGEAYDLKKAYSNEVSKLVKGGDAGTSQYKSLADSVSFLNKEIDNIIETKLGTQFAEDKGLYRDLLTLADDMVASSLVDGRRSANTLAERIGMLESITSPVASTKKKLIDATEKLNTRGGAWEELIKRYDENAVKALGEIK